MSNEITVRPEDNQGGAELAVSAQQEMARSEVEGSLILARRFPRNQLSAFAKVVESCGRFGFASLAVYGYKRAGQQIEGPSVKLIREMARCWGNIRYGADVISDSEDSRTVRGWAWDLETNTKETQDTTFKKLIQRKGKGWIIPDERDLRELTNRQAAFCVRNCLEHLLPPDLVADAVKEAKTTIHANITSDPAEARKNLIKAFQTLGVTVEDLESFIGHPLTQANADEITEFRMIYKSISDGNSIWSEYVTKDDAGDDVVAAFNATKKTTPKKKAKKKEPEQPVTLDADNYREDARVDTLAAFGTTDAVNVYEDEGVLCLKPGAEVDEFREACQWRREAIRSQENNEN